MLKCSIKRVRHQRNCVVGEKIQLQKVKSWNSPEIPPFARPSFPFSWDTYETPFATFFLLSWNFPLYTLCPPSNRNPWNSSIDRLAPFSSHDTLFSPFIRYKPIKIPFLRFRFGSLVRPSSAHLNNSWDPISRIQYITPSNQKFR